MMSDPNEALQVLKVALAELEYLLEHKYYAQALGMVDAIERQTNKLNTFCTSHFQTLGDE
jgi:hypothetical protein